MARREARQYKALYFDIHVQALREFYPKKNHLGAYKDIKRYLLNHGFTHEQWSGYHSVTKMTDLEIFDLVHDMARQSCQWRPCRGVTLYQTAYATTSAAQSEKHMPQMPAAPWAQ